MKKLLLLSLILALGVLGFAQNRAIVPNQLRDFAVKKVQPITETMNFSNEALPANKNYWPPEEEIYGNTWYDLQSNTSMQNRIFVYEDGTIGGVFTFGMEYTAFPDRGTGYNYYDGNSWGPLPTERIESDRTGWPAYAPFGENGEINVCHYSGALVDGLAFSKRDEKGTGVWTQWDYLGPVGHEALLWPRMTTGGVDHSVIHLIPLTMPVANGGAIYEGMDGALLYSRSTDGGETWDPENLLLDEINSDYYNGFSGDTYEIQAQGDNVAFLAGDSWTDLVLMKSTNGGDDWEKIVIWENPYPLWSGTTTDTFYCADGDHGLTFDQSGMIHVVFGINRAHAETTNQYWFPFVDGVAYWNESMPTFSNNLNALNPYGHPDSELIDNYNLIGWTQDVNGDGEITFVCTGTECIGLYYVGLSSMPQILIDEMNQVFVVFASVTETYDNGLQNYRHLWCRASTDNGVNWEEDFYDLTSDLIHLFDECVFPSIASNSDDYFYLVYQTDDEPGLAVRGDEDPYGENFIRLMKVLKEDVIDAIKENNQVIFDYDVSQNYPNPFNGTSVVNVNLRHSADLSLEIVNIMGQKVYELNAGYAKQGINEIVIDGSELTSGIYFYTVKAGDTSITKKMIVD
ncbi:MAG: T9SS type A sorting domain-containing protein [Bacteroidetes bacterium]|nr:T9SS type A sorting domain-containing protein [Bacteroidota bacterium]MBL7104506.1 T9SS type A sorting domain-containing protein [Bacteroidales bacterium]